MDFMVILPAFISFQELTVIMVIAVILFGPKKIPEIARGLGEGIRAMKKASEEIKQELMNPVEDLKEEIKKQTKDVNPVQEIQDAIEETTEDINKSLPENPVKDIKDSLDDMVGPIKRS